MYHPNYINLDRKLVSRIKIVYKNYLAMFIF